MQKGRHQGFFFLLLLTEDIQVWRKHLILSRVYLVTAQSHNSLNKQPCIRRINLIRGGGEVTLFTCSAFTKGLQTPISLQSQSIHIYFPRSNSLKMLMILAQTICIIQQRIKGKCLPIKEAVIECLPSFISCYRQHESGCLIMRPRHYGTVFMLGKTTQNQK